MKEKEKKAETEIGDAKGSRIFLCHDAELHKVSADLEGLPR